VCESFTLSRSLTLPGSLRASVARRRAHNFASLDRPERNCTLSPSPDHASSANYHFDLWQSQEFLQAVSDWDIDGLIIGGVELICYVLYAVLGAEERGFTYVVPRDVVSGMRSTEQVPNHALRA